MAMTVLMFVQWNKAIDNGYVVMLWHQRVRLLEEKTAALGEELNAARHLEPIVDTDALEQLERRLQRAENELAAGDVLRDNLRTDREKVYLF